MRRLSGKDSLRALKWRPTPCVRSAARKPPSPSGLLKAVRCFAANVSGSDVRLPAPEPIRGQKSTRGGQFAYPSQKTRGLLFFFGAWSQWPRGNYHNGRKSVCAFLKNINYDARGCCTASTKVVRLTRLDGEVIVAKITFIDPLMKRLCSKCFLPATNLNMKSSTRAVAASVGPDDPATLTVDVGAPIEFGHVDFTAEYGGTVVPQSLTTNCNDVLHP